MKATAIVSNAILMVVSISIAGLMAEGFIRYGTAEQQNYVIEMWRYAKLLKRKSDNPDVGHEHIPQSHARLQNIDVSINELGMRGPLPRTNAPHRIAIIGDSIAFGWGVSESETLRGHLDSLLPDNIDVINAGVGNLNLFQAASHWKDISRNVDADILVVLPTQRSNVRHIQEETNWLVKNSVLAALGATFFKQLMSGQYGEQALIDGLKDRWSSQQGDTILRQAFDSFDQYAKGHKAHVIIVNIPDSHDFNNYKFGFVDDKLRELSDSYGFVFYNPLQSLQGPPSRQYWASSNDIHLNGAAYKIIANALNPIIDDIYENKAENNQ